MPRKAPKCSVEPVRTPRPHLRDQPCTWRLVHGNRWWHCRRDRPQPPLAWDPPRSDSPGSARTGGKGQVPAAQSAETPFTPPVWGNQHIYQR